MLNIKWLLVFSILWLSGCNALGSPKLGPDGKPLPKIYKLNRQNVAEVKFRMLDAVNALRVAKGIQVLEFNSELNAAAATHARDMSIQNRPWHFGSDGSSPLDRVARVGYEQVFLGETISETYESEITTLTAWINSENTRDVILDPRANELGFAWYQERNGKIWWTMILGGKSLSMVQKKLAYQFLLSYKFRGFLCCSQQYIQLSNLFETSGKVYLYRV